jgi:hypothetical protein
MTNEASSRVSTPVNSDNEDQEEMTEDQKRYLASAKRRAAKSGRAGGQAIGGESCSSQMAASSGSTDTRVTGGHPSKNLSCILSSAEVLSSPSKVVPQPLPRHHRIQGVKDLRGLGFPKGAAKPRIRAVVQ